MPEGDTVFLAGRRLNDALAGKTLVGAELRHPELSTVDLTGHAVLGVRSVGKHLFTRFASPDSKQERLSLHTRFRMDGSWHLYRSGQQWKRVAHHARAVLSTDDRIAVGFRLHDMKLLPTMDEEQLVSRLGPDLLGDDWSVEQEAEAVRRLTADPGREIGLALLDQTIMAGVGNIYRTEVCFVLGVTPWSPVAEVDARRVVLACRKLLLCNAWRPERSTTGELGRGREHWVYMRHGRACRRCGTRVRSAVSGSHQQERTTWYCPTCQRGSC
ncbi:MAG: DNA-formamidopyrimidine glycosylase family protein [Sciscionella sp.]